MASSEGTHTFCYDVCFESVVGIPSDPGFKNLQVVWRRGVHAWVSDSAAVDARSRSATWSPPADITRSYALEPKMYGRSRGFAIKPTRFDVEEAHMGRGGKTVVLGSAMFDLSSVLSILPTEHLVRLQLKGSTCTERTALLARITCRWEHEGSAPAQEPEPSPSRHAPRSPWHGSIPPLLSSPRLSTFAITGGHGGYGAGAVGGGRTAAEPGAQHHAQGSEPPTTPVHALRATAPALASSCGRPSTAPFRREAGRAPGRWPVQGARALEAEFESPRPPSASKRQAARTGTPERPRRPLPSPSPRASVAADAATIVTATDALASLSAARGYGGSRGGGGGAHPLLDGAALRAHVLSSLDAEAMSDALGPAATAARDMRALSEPALGAELRPALEAARDARGGVRARVRALLGVEARALWHGLCAHPAFASLVPDLGGALVDALLDLRAPIVKEACTALSALACALRERACGEARARAADALEDTAREGSPGRAARPRGAAAALEPLVLLALPPLLRQSASSHSRHTRLDLLLCATALLRAAGAARCACHPHIFGALLSVLGPGYASALGRAHALYCARVLAEAAPPAQLRAAMPALRDAVARGAADAHAETRSAARACAATLDGLEAEHAERRAAAAEAAAAAQAAQAVTNPARPAEEGLAPTPLVSASPAPPTAALARRARRLCARVPAARALRTPALRVMLTCTRPRARMCAHRTRSSASSPRWPSRTPSAPQRPRPRPPSRAARHQAACWRPSRRACSWR